MRISMRYVVRGVGNQYGSGRGTQESERRRVLLGGYRVASPDELDEGERAQTDGYDHAVVTPGGELYAIGVTLEPGDH